MFLKETNLDVDPLTELLAIQASDLYYKLNDMRISAYMSLSLGKATKLERICDRAGKRSYRRFSMLQQHLQGAAI
jgi:hypothetical protein